jgi:hypothetical protein
MSGDNLSNGSKRISAEKTQNSEAVRNGAPLGSSTLRR